MSNLFGVTPTGFKVKTVTQLVAEVNADVQSIIAADIDVSPDQPLGQLIGIIMEKVAEVWELEQAGYNATNRGGSEGDQLANIGSLTGTPPLGPSPSSVYCGVAFTLAGTYVARSLVCYLNPPFSNSVQFQNADDIIVPALVGGNPISNANPYVVAELFQSTNNGPSFGDALVAADGPEQVQITGIAQSGPGGVIQILTTYGTTIPQPSNPAAFIVTLSDSGSAVTNAQFVATWVDSTHFNLIGTTYSTPFTCNVNPGGQLAQMTPVSGWLAVADIDGPTIGTLQETDAAYRVRQVLELSEPGACTLPAIQAHILQALADAPSPVVGASVTMYENTTLSPDANGLPGKSFEAVVFDGINPNKIQNDPIIGQQIWNNKPAGMQAFGSVQVVVLDSNGNQRYVYFSRAVEVQIYMVINVAKGAQAADPTDMILEAIVNASQGQPFTLYGTTITPTNEDDTTLLPGQDIVLNAFRAIVQGQAGVKDVPSMFIGTAPNPTGTSNLPMTVGQVGVVTATNLIVNVAIFVP